MSGTCRAYRTFFMCGASLCLTACQCKQHGPATILGRRLPPLRPLYLYSITMITISGSRASHRTWEGLTVTGWHHNASCHTSAIW